MCTHINFIKCLTISKRQCHSLENCITHKEHVQSQINIYMHAHNMQFYLEPQRWGLCGDDVFVVSFELGI